MVEENTPKVSVVMSVYKERIDWLRTSIESILQQTFSDFEFIIICDNPLYDEGFSVLKKYQANDNRIIIIKNEENIGLTKSLNKGLTIANGEYIARMDADDISMKNRFEVQIDFLRNNPEIVACGSFITVINEKGEKIENRTLSKSPQQIRENLIFSSPIAHPAAMFKRVLNGEPVKYNENRRYSQDYALWVSLAANHDLANVPEYLLCYRESNVQISSKNHKEQQLCARQNSEDAINALGLILSETEKNVIYGMTRDDSIFLSIQEIEQAITNIYANNYNNKKVNIKKILRHLVLVYCNYLPKHMNLFSALYHFLGISFKTRCFDSYSVLSLINKYRN